MNKNTSFVKFQNSVDKRKISKDVKSSQRRKKKSHTKKSEVRMASDF